MRSFATSLTLAVSVAVFAMGSVDTAQARSKAHKQIDTNPGTFDYYVMSLSWSPVYCETHQSDRQQCGKKRFGFVLHGLWPQYAAGGYPQACSTDPLDADAKALGATIFPSSKLVAHEWQVHGTCSGMTASDYFKTADNARNSIAIPDALSPGPHVAKMTADQIKAAVTAKNPGLDGSALAVTCSGPELQEVRVCLSKDLKPIACGKDVRTSCRTGTVRIPGAQ